MIPLIKINSFRESSQFIMDNERKKAFLSLNKDSIFLKRVIASKEKEKKNSISRIANTEKIPKIIPNQRHKNSIKIFKTFENRNKSPIYFPKKANISSDKIYNKRYENNNNIDNCIKNTNININEFKLNPTIQTYKAKAKINTFYHKRPTNILKEYSFSPRVLQYKFSTYDNNKNNKFENERNVLNYKGKKIFSNSSFRDLSNNSISGSSKNLCDHSSELFRNYSQLKQKKEEIFRRKMKKNNSAQNKEMFKIQEDKDIKKETINFIVNNNNNKINSNNNDGKKIRKIPIDRKRANYYMLRNKNKEISKESYSKDSIQNNNNIELNYLLKDISKKVNINNYLCYMKERMSYNFKRNKNNILKKENNITFNNENIDYSNIIKDNSKNINNKNIVNNTEKENSSNIISDNFVKYKTLDFNLKNGEKREILDNNNDINKCNILKKKFVEDNLNNSIYCSKDKKLMIKLHSIQNINQLFTERRKKKQKLKIERNINIFLNNNTKSYFNYITKCKVKKPQKIKRKKLLSSIKEVEEKSRTDLTKSESQIEEQEKIIYKINKIKNINDLNKIFISDKDNIQKEKIN